MQTNFHNETWSPGRCPSRELLVNLSLGRIGSPAFEMWSSHIEECPECQTNLEAASDASDSFVNDLRHAKELPTPVEDGTPLHRMIEQAETISRDAWRGPHQGTGELLESRTLGRYTLVRLLGRGGMGSVFKAVHAHLQRPVALKLLPESLTKNPMAVDRFRQEMIAVGKLDHPNIVRAHDADVIDGRMFLVMELISGVDLGKLVRKHGPMSIQWACRMTRQATLGLHYAHQHGLVHRDVKPSNLMITKDGGVKLLDLGLARLVTAEDQQDQNARAPIVMGTADFMAPEQGVNADLADARSDIYSLGCTLYALLAGRPPFSSDQPQTFFEKAKAHRTEPVPPLSNVRSDVPTALVKVIDTMLAKDPANRYQSAEEVAVALEPFVSELRVVKPLPVSATPPEPLAMFAEYDAHARATPSLLRRVLRLAGIAAILTLGVGIVMLMQQPGIVEHLEGLFAADAEEAPGSGSQVRPSPPVVFAQRPAETGQPDDVKSKPVVLENPAVPPERPVGPPLITTVDARMPVTEQSNATTTDDVKSGKAKNPPIKLSTTEPVYFEAERYVSLDPHLKHNFDKRNSGGAYVFRPPDEEIAGGAVYRLEVPRASTWHLWAVVRATTYDNNSLIIEVHASGRQIARSTWHLHPPGSGWRWMTLSDKEYGLNRVPLSLPAGEVELHVIGREPGVAWDKMMLTPRADVTPK